MNIVLWILQVLLSLLFLFSGASKFFIPYEEMAKQMPVALPRWFILFIGVCEILGALGLVIPWLTGIKRGLTPLAASGLVIIMIGATAITAMGNVPQALFPLVVGVLCAVVAWGRRSAAAS